MKDKNMDDFYNSAVNYCRVIETFDSNQETNKLKTIFVSLLDLYTKALYLPDVERQNKCTINFGISVPSVDFGQSDNYWEVFEPYQFEELLVGSLADNI